MTTRCFRHFRHLTNHVPKRRDVGLHRQMVRAVGAVRSVARIGLSRTALTTERANSTGARPRTDYIGNIGLRSGIDETIGACPHLLPNRVVISGCNCLLKRSYNLDGSVHLSG